MLIFCYDVSQARDVFNCLSLAKTSGRTYGYRRHTQARSGKQKGSKMYNAYNPFNFNQGTFNQQTTIQNLAQTSATQAQIYFVSSPKDMEKIQPTLNVVYVGINRDKNEIYLRQMNNAGLIDFSTYSLSTGEQEKNDFVKIMERLDKIENKVLSKGVDNADNAANGPSNGAAVHAGTNAEPSANATV